MSCLVREKVAARFNPFALTNLKVLSRCIRNAIHKVEWHQQQLNYYQLTYICMYVCVCMHACLFYKIVVTGGRQRFTT